LKDKRQKIWEHKERWNKFDITRVEKAYSLRSCAIILDDAEVDEPVS
jgi:hypothetical protein